MIFFGCYPLSPDPINDGLRQPRLRGADNLSSLSTSYPIHRVCADGRCCLTAPDLPKFLPQSPAVSLPTFPCGLFPLGPITTTTAILQRRHCSRLVPATNIPILTITDVDPPIPSPSLSHPGLIRATLASSSPTTIPSVFSSLTRSNKSSSLAFNDGIRSTPRRRSGSTALHHAVTIDLVHGPR